MFKRLASGNSNTEHFQTKVILETLSLQRQLDTQRYSVLECALWFFQQLSYVELYFPEPLFLYGLGSSSAAIVLWSSVLAGGIKRGILRSSWGPVRPWISLLHIQLSFCPAGADEHQWAQAHHHWLLTRWGSLRADDFRELLRQLPCGSTPAAGWACAAFSRKLWLIHPHQALWWTDCVPLKFIWWMPKPQYLRIFGDRAFKEVIKVKMRSCGWVLVWSFNFYLWTFTSPALPTTGQSLIVFKINPWFPNPQDGSAPLIEPRLTHGEVINMGSRFLLMQKSNL